MTTLILFIFGAIVGSFLNVLGLRWNSGLTLNGRSKCSTCGKTLGPLELVPVLSFLFQRGRCRGCKAQISWQYPLIELWTALLFVTVPLILVPIFCIYVVITIYDFRHKIIPDSLIYPAIILSIFYRSWEFKQCLPGVGNCLLDVWAGPILFGIFALIWVISRGRAIGFADSKLALSIGLILGASVGFSAVVLAFWLGALVGVALLIRSKILQ